LNVQLNAEHLVRLDEVSDVPKGVPHETLAGSASRFSGGKILAPAIIPVA